MSLLFDRSYRAVITGEGEARTIDGLRMSFDVRKTRSSTPNTCDAVFWNPSEQTRRVAQATDAEIEIYAGYGGEAKLISRAQINRAIVVRQPPDILLEIEAQEGQRNLREKTVSVSHSGGARVENVLNELTGILGFDVRPIEFDLGQELRGGFSHVGKVSRAMDDLVKRFGGDWSVQNGEVLVLPPEGFVGTAEVPVISAQTGMINSPEPVEDQTSTERKSTEARNGYKVTSLLQPTIEPGDRFELRALDAQGVFAVDAVEHQGDTRGRNWYSVITGYET